MSLTLPTELIAQVIAHAVPAPDPHTLQSRYDFLLACSQANSTLRAIAQEHLFTHVRLRTPRAIRSFHYGVTGDLGALGDKVIQLCVGDVASGTVGGDRDQLGEDDQLCEALGFCHNIEDITLCDLEIDVQDLAMFPAARRLHLRNCFISTGLTSPGHLSATSFALTHLTHLSLHSPFPHSLWGLLLHLCLLPSLRSLAVSSPVQLDNEPLGSPDAFESALTSVAPQLTEFASLGHSGLSRLLTKSLLWQHFTALRHLTLASARPHQALLQIPGALDTLRVDFQPRSADGFTVEMSQIGIQIFNEEVDSVRGLKEICFPGWEGLIANGTISRRVHEEAWDKFEEEGVRVVHLSAGAPFVSRI